MTAVDASAGRGAGCGRGGQVRASQEVGAAVSCAATGTFFLALDVRFTFLFSRDPFAPHTSTESRSFFAASA